MHGHFDTPINIADAIEDVVGSGSVNMGIGIVVPIDHVLNFMDDAFGDDEKKAVQELREKYLPTMDSAENAPDPEFTKADFESALRKVSRKIAPEK